MKDYELIESTLLDMVPDPETFKDSVYPAEEVQADEEALRCFKEAPDYKERGERTNAKILEKIFMEFAEQEAMERAKKGFCLSNNFRPKLPDL